MPAGAGLMKAREWETGKVAAVWAEGGKERLPFATQGNQQRKSPGATHGTEPALTLPRTKGHERGL